MAGDLRNSDEGEGELLGGYRDLSDDRVWDRPVTADTARAASRLTRARSLLAQTNSVARIPRPIGMTTKAGPGNTRRARPMSRTVHPTTRTISLLACLNVWMIRLCIIEEVR